MSSHHNLSVSAPATGPALTVFVLGIPLAVVLAVAVVLNWGR